MSPQRPLHRAAQQDSERIPRWRTEDQPATCLTRSGVLARPSITDYLGRQPRSRLTRSPRPWQVYHRRGSNRECGDAVDSQLQGTRCRGIGLAARQNTPADSVKRLGASVDPPMRSMGRGGISATI
jgi:hypothetical protein